MDAFNSVDTDHNHTIDKKEFYEILWKQNSVNIEQNDATAIKQVMDTIDEHWRLLCEYVAKIRDDIVDPESKDTNIDFIEWAKYMLD